MRTQHIGIWRADAVEAENGAEPAAQGPAQAEEDGPMSMDQIVEQCLEGGLLAVPDGELPIMTSDFYSKYMLPCRPAGDLRSPIVCMRRKIRPVLPMHHQAPWSHMSCSQNPHAMAMLLA